MVADGAVFYHSGSLPRLRRPCESGRYPRTQGNPAFIAMHHRGHLFGGEAAARAWISLFFKVFKLFAPLKRLPFLFFPFLIIFLIVSARVLSLPARRTRSPLEEVTVYGIERPPHGKRRGRLGVAGENGSNDTSALSSQWRGLERLGGKVGRPTRKWYL